ncbi:MAG: adenylate/guanylate cyclase domain-containing protein [Spirochaetia bacterium]|nr:adenylate/guanylate cyclase domain-containing protein [Spirochaetia bacterium]
MIDLSLLNETTEILANNFTPGEIESLGKIIYSKYDGHKAAGVKNHITMSPRKCANALVQFLNESKKTFQLIKLIIEMDDSALNGKAKNIEGLEAYLNKLVKSDIYYDFKKRKLHHSKKDAHKMINWGILNDGKTYSITVMSLDIVGNSMLVKKHGTKTMEKVYFRLRNFIEKKVLDYDGRIWNFAGDGGLIAFTLKEHPTRAALCALDIRAALAVFNIRPDLPIKEHISLRLALDTGKIKFSSNTGHIVSDIINYAAHLEKAGTLPGEISISENVKKDLAIKVAKVFSDKNVFENMNCYSTV